MVYSSSSESVPVLSSFTSDSDDTLSSSRSVSVAENYYNIIVCSDLGMLHMYVLYLLGREVQSVVQWMRQDWLVHTA